MPYAPCARTQGEAFGLPLAECFAHPPSNGQVARVVLLTASLVERAASPFKSPPTGKLPVVLLTASLVERAASPFYPPPKACERWVLCSILSSAIPVPRASLRSALPCAEHNLTVGARQGAHGRTAGAQTKGRSLLNHWRGAFVEPEGLRTRRWLWQGYHCPHGPTGRAALRRGRRVGRALRASRWLYRARTATGGVNLCANPRAPAPVRESGRICVFSPYILGFGNNHDNFQEQHYPAGAP